jgi:Leucine-rich repeat (LRR) protein
MLVLPETPRFKAFYIPKRLVVTKELTNLRPDEEPAELTAIPEIRFRKADAQTVRFRVRNGHSFYTWINRKGTLGGGGTQGNFVLVPDSPNPIDQGFGYKGGDVKMDYQMKVCEYAYDGFRFGPGPGSPGYRLLWSRTYHVSLTGKEFRQLPAMVVNVPAKTDNRDCIALIRANPEVEDLSLDNTGITDAGLTAVGRLKHLRKLSLYHTDITDTGLAHLRHLTRLKTLYLDGTKVTDAGVLGLRRLTRLENLPLSNTAITDKGAAVVSGFHHLKHLDLINTQIGDATLSRLRNLKQLESLFLPGTRVTDEGLQYLIQLDHLQYVRLPATITDKGVETIKLALPNCSVEVQPLE